MKNEVKAKLKKMGCGKLQLKDRFFRKRVLYLFINKKMLSTIKLNKENSLLDIGCGTGLFCEMASLSGCKITGIDSSEELLSFSKKRFSKGNFKKASMENIPFKNHCFGYITGINSFQFPKNPLKSLLETYRVLTDDDKLVIALWGNHKNCGSASYLFVFNSLIPNSENKLPLPFIFSGEGIIESLVLKAGFKSGKRIIVNCPRYYPNLNIALKGILSSGPGKKAILSSSYDEVSKKVAKAIEPYKTPGGKYKMNNEFFFIICSKEK